MKLIKFRIQHYKAIKDSGWCWLASDVTTLAGKNESGKTAILEALRNFDVEVETVSDSAMPLDDSGEPVIEMCFDVEKWLLDEIAEETSITINKETREHISANDVTIIKYYDGKYDLEEELKTLLTKQRDESNAKGIENIKKVVGNLSEIKQLSATTKPVLEGDIANIRQSVIEYVDQILAQITAIPDEETQQNMSVAIEGLILENEVLDTDHVSSKFLNTLVRYMPNFIFFSDFVDILPFEVPFVEARKNRTVQDFAKLSGLDLDKVISATDPQRRRNMLSEHSARISGDFRSHWEQDKLDLLAEPDGEKLRLGVRESGRTSLFKAEQRSKGFQWFLSFYLRLNAERGERNIILIDEPGLYLHAKAQEDVLKVFEKISEKSQVIISTHSPYLIDTQRLDRVRLILKDDRTGTRIENKIHKDADTDTLTPIITAIGLDISNEFSIAGKRNVLLEGISDYYFMQSFRKSLKIDEVNCIPCVGAEKIVQVASLLIGWDLKYVAVLDNDSKGNKIAKVLREKLSIAEDRIIFISGQDGFSIEDLFTYNDFNDSVLEGEKNEDTNILNSKYLKDNKLDKVLLAKKFFEKMRDDETEIKLSKETVDGFGEVFKKIAEGFK